MRVNKRVDWYRCLDANDNQYGVGQLAICDQQALLRYLQRYSHRLPQGISEVFQQMGNFDRYQQLQLMIRFYQCYPSYYEEHVVASGVLEPPVGMGGGYFTTKEILERLEGAPPPRNYAFGVGVAADGPWSKAIGMLREKIGLPKEGGYDMETAIKLYQAGKGKWRIGRGYLYSDNNPDVLFDNRYQEYITVVNSEVWALAGLDINYFHENSHETWYKKIPEVLDFDKRLTQEDDYQKKILPTLRRIFSVNTETFEKSIGQWHPSDADMGIPFDDEFFLKTIVNETQRAIWAMGAEAGYGLMGLDLTWYLLMHSLSDDPQDIIIKENVNYFFDNVIENIKKNREFLRRLDLFLNKQSDSFFEELIDDVKFESADSLDLFASLHSSDILVNGHKNKDGTWNLEFKLTDKYDFTELVNPFIQEITKKDNEGKEVKYKKLAGMGYFAGWLANDGAYLSQSLGAIAPYKVTIYFSMENYEVKELK